MFIVFEGGEGAGKTTQIALLSKYLAQHNIKHICTREPGGTPLAEKIRELLLESKQGIQDIITELLLINAARREHIVNVIKPALQDSAIVLCDRFIASTMVYQGIVGGGSLHDIKELNKIVLGDVMPDITFYLDIDPALAQQRRQQREAQHRSENHYDNKALTFHYAVREGFHQLFVVEPLQEKSKAHLLDAARTPDDVHQDIMEILKKHCVL